MSSKLKSNKSRSRSGKTVFSKSSSSMKRQSKPVMPKPQNNETMESEPGQSSSSTYIPSFIEAELFENAAASKCTDDSSFTSDDSLDDFPFEELKKSNNIDLNSPKMLKYFLHSYKYSPNYEAIKNKRFNTSFPHGEIPRGDRDIEIFPPEEQNSPVIENRMGPGDEHANIFMNMPGLSDSDEDMKKVEMKGVRNKGKRGRKRSIGSPSSSKLDKKRHFR